MLKKEEFLQQVTVTPFTASDGSHWYKGVYQLHVFGFATTIEATLDACRETYCKDTLAEYSADDLYY